MGRVMDDPFWNYLELPTPVILSSQLHCDSAYTVVSQLKLIMNEIKNTMNDISQLDLEAATLSRLIYRTNHKQRQEKSFKALQKINRCLTNYLTMHWPFTLSSIHDTLNADYGPTRQMMEWALVRLFGLVQLFHRVYLLCMDAAGHLFVRIKLTHMWELTVFAVATVSRIWTFSQFIVRHACEWYRSLYKFLDKLQPSPTDWLPENVILPHDLAKSLGNPQYLKLKSVNKPSKMLSQLKFSSVSKAEKDELTRNIAAVMDIDMFDDVGESVARDSFRNHSDISTQLSGPSVQRHAKKRKYKETGKKSLKARKTQSKSKLHSIKNLKSSQDLLKFIKVETALRNKSNSMKTGISYQSVMKNIDEEQWTVIKKFIGKQIKILEQNEKSANIKQQEKLLKRVRKKIKKLIS